MILSIASGAAGAVTVLALLWAARGLRIVASAFASADDSAVGAEAVSWWELRQARQRGDGQ